MANMFHVIQRFIKTSIDFHVFAKTELRKEDRQSESKGMGDRVKIWWVYV